jgi:hypothetical protein
MDQVGHADSKMTMDVASEDQKSGSSLSYRMPRSQGRVSALCRGFRFMAR